MGTKKDSKLKVLYVSNFADGTGYSHAAINNMMALDSVGVDVVARHVKLNDKVGEIPQRILDLAGKSIGGCDYCIQHLLPHMMEYVGGFKKCVGSFYNETNNFRASSWPLFLNSMDEVWVGSKFSERACENSFVHTPTKSFPVPCYPDTYLKQYHPPSFRLNKPTTFIFYFIGEILRRKNLAALLKAFHMEFEPYEEVDLLIKANVVNNIPPKDHFGYVNNFCTEVKKGLKKFTNIAHYKQEMILVDSLSELEMMGLHQHCDCLVMPSYGEGYSIPARDGLLFGSTPIVAKNSSFTDFISNGNGWLVPCNEDCAFGLEGFDDLYTSDELVGNINISQLRIAMRQAYSNKELRQKKIDDGVESGLEYHSYDRVGKLMVERLLESHN